MTMNTCLMVLKKMISEGIESDNKVPISYQDLINRATGDPLFRANLVVDCKKTIDINNYEVNDDDMKEISGLSEDMKMEIRKRLNRYLNV